MLLIDENVDSELEGALKAFRHEPNHTTRCIRFNLTNKQVPPGIKEVVIDSVRRNLHENNPRIFFCDKSDILIFADAVRAKSGNAVILDMVNHVNLPADDSWVIFDELARYTNALLTEVETKLEHKRAAQEALRKLQEEQQHERKRQAILKSGANHSSVEIRQRREKRSAPELMIIEDDAFSRRLVENVLQKKYALTCLGDASFAIDIYAKLAPDLLFLDINLPDVTGHELLERILAIDPNAHVIMLSGNADQANIVEAMSKGAKGFIAKPFTKEKLFQYIDRCAGIANKQSNLTVS